MPPATARVYVSAATTVVPKLTADVTVRDLFLEPGATLDTNGFTLTVTNNADAGRTIIGTGQTVLTGNGSVAAGVFSNLVIAGRITLALGTEVTELRPGELVLTGTGGTRSVAFDAVFVMIGTIAPWKFLESCGVQRVSNAPTPAPPPAPASP